METTITVEILNTTKNAPSISSSEDAQFNNNAEIEWMILPKKKSLHNPTAKPNDCIQIASVQKVNSKGRENFIVSPIFLKKKSTFQYCLLEAEETSNNEEIDVLNNSKFIKEDSDCNKHIPINLKCQVVIPRMNDLDELAMECESSVNQIKAKSTPLRCSMRSTSKILNNSKVFDCIPSKVQTNVKSARKRLDLTPSSSSAVKTAVGHGFLTPTILERSERFLPRNSSDLEQIRVNLQASTLPQSLPCRSAEYDNVRTFVLRKLADGSGGCMYISGVPGTGKTATVHAVIKQLQQEYISNAIPLFDFVEVNGLRLTEPRQAYVRIWQALTGNKVVVEQAMKNLEKKFLARPQRTTVILFDELDYLCNKRQDVIYNLLDWTTKQYSRLIILTIANTMDLPERTLKGKITSRMGLTRLVFQPYTHQQLQEIVMNRLGGCTNFHPDAVQLVARKVAAISGDARRALDICRRGIEDLENDASKTVTVFDINRVISGIFSGVRVQAIRNSSATCKLILRSIRDEALRTGIEETTFINVYNQLHTICTLEGVYLPNPGELSLLCNLLADNGLIVIEKNRADFRRKLSLNVSPDDIHYALN